LNSIKASLLSGIVIAVTIGVSGQSQPAAPVTPTYTTTPVAPTYTTTPNAPFGNPIPGSTTPYTTPPVIQQTVPPSAPSNPPHVPTINIPPAPPPFPPDNITSMIKQAMLPNRFWY
jgi:hypothetical protein